MGTTGMRDWRGVFQKILGEVVRVANGKPVSTRERRLLRLKSSTCGVGICCAARGRPRVAEKMARRDDSQASSWPSWIEALCFPLGERSAEMGWTRDEPTDLFGM